MKERWQFIMKKLVGPPLIMIASLFISYQIISIWWGISHYQVLLSKERLYHAIEVSPLNPDPYYRLALFYQWDLQNIDFEKSIQYLKKAIERNPLEQQYWIDLARGLHRLGEKQDSEKALDNAVRLFPTGYQGRWITANLLLQQGKLQKALPHFIYILQNYPEQTVVVYELLTKAIDDKDFIFEKVVPRDSSSIMRYLHFLYEIGDKESAQKVWAKKSFYGWRPNRAETIRYINFLIEHNVFHEAHRVWITMLREEGIPVQKDGNLITNGGFERKDTLGVGFDWRIGKVKGVEMTVDSTTAFEGEASLKMVFDGKENVNFYHLYQYVAWEPGTNYILKGRMKTNGITTKSGLKVEVLGVGTGFHQYSESLMGDNDWKELTIAFKTPINSQGGIVRLRRERSNKFDRFIAGTVWIDNFSLMEKK